MMTMTMIITMMMTTKMMTVATFENIGCNI